MIGDSPDELLTRLGTAAVLLRRVARSLGFEVSFADGKTEAFFAVHAPGYGAATVLLADLEVAVDGESPRHLLPLESGGLLRIVTQYKHVGAWRRTNGELGREQARRSAAGLAASSALARGFLNKAEVPVVERAAVARACVHSRVLYQSGAWPLLSLFKKVAVAYRRPLRIICGAHRPPLDGFVQESNLSVRLKVHALPMEWEIVFSRLRMAVLARGRSLCWPWCSHVAVRAGGGHCSGR